MPLSMVPRAIPQQMTAYTNIIPDLNFLGPREMCILICHQAEKESDFITIVAAIEGQSLEKN